MAPSLTSRASAVARWSSVGLALSAVLLGLWQGGAWAEEAAPDIEVFAREGCPRCAEAHAFLDKLQRERPLLRIRYHDVARDPAALERLSALASKRGVTPGVPAFVIRDQLVVGYDGEARTGQGIRALLEGKAGELEPGGICSPSAAESCAPPDEVRVRWLGRLSARELGMPLFTLAVGLIDGFNPCAMWVLLFLLSLLANLRSRSKMLAIAGTFVLVSGAAYYLFMAAWLNVFLLVGLTRAAQVVLGIAALGVGLIHVKDFFGFKKGVSLSIPESARPGIYARVRNIVQAPSLWAAIAGASALAVLVNLVELLCTAGLPAVYTQILVSRRLPAWQHYAYLGLYDLAYMADDILMLTIAVVTLGRRKLQERAGRGLKLLSGTVLVALGGLLVFKPSWLAL